MTESPSDFTDGEWQALHHLQLGVEHLNRAYGHLLSFHHAVGHAMDHFADAEAALRESGHDAYANALRDHHLPAGVVDDSWSYELVEAFESGFLADAVDFESTVREELAGGVPHVTERALQRDWRDRAQG